MTKQITAVLLSCSGLELTDDEKRLFAAANPVGVALFGRNIKTAAQIRKLTTEIKETIGRDDVLIAVDQEGGRVRRLAGAEFHQVAHNITLGQLPPAQAAEASRLQALLISDDLLRCGINLNLAPVLDRLQDDTSPVLKSRCFSSDEKVISRLGNIMIDEYLNNHICPCVKHLPGHGRANVDPHLQLPIITASLDELAADFYPFQQASSAPSGLTAHIILEQVDPQFPVTQSAKAIQKVIRGLLNFDGFLFSDALEMHALKGSLSEKATLALNAGCDCVVYALGNIDDLKTLAAVCPPLTDQAQERLHRISRLIADAPAGLDTQSAAAQYQALIGQIEPYEDTYDATEILNILQQTRRNQ